MTMYKCEQCAEVWSKGPMRDAILEGWTCPSCITAKLQEAEEATTRIRIAHETEVLNSNCLRKRAEAAEEDARTWKGLFHNMQLVEEKLRAEVARLRAQNAIIDKSSDWACARIAELEAAGRELIRTQEEATRTATEAALKYAYSELSEVQEAYDRGVFISKALKALLGEDA